MQDLTYVVGDAETYYNSKSGYTLRVMDTPSYLLDPQFELIGAAFKIMKGGVVQKTRWVDGPEVPDYLRSLGDPERVVFIAHNLLFDACLLSYRYRWVAGFYIDTLALSRALLGHYLLRHDLDSVSRYLGLGAKGDTVLKVNGLNRQTIIQSGLYNEYAAYSCLDADLCWGIFRRLAPAMPPNELVINDIVHRMAIKPVLRYDAPLLYEHLAQVQAEKEMLLYNAGIIDKGELLSNEKFAQTLIRMGVTPPRKISLTTGEATWAFAKTDEGMKALLDHPDVAVQTLAAARLGIKSTIEESRTQRFINISRLDFPELGTCVAPVPLKPSGAHTHRLSGDWKMNKQNLTRYNPVKKKRAMLRESLVTPEGYSMVVADESQIELRGTAMFCNQKDMLADIRAGVDIYCKGGSKWYGRTITKADIGPRFCSKTGHLSCQYQVGWRKYQGSVRHLSLEQIGQRIELTDEQAFNHVNIYRTNNYAISGMWRTLLYHVIPSMTNRVCDFMFPDPVNGPVRVMHEKIVLPNGLCLYYRNLHRNSETLEWQFVYGREIKKLYGGKLLENIIQALCRIIVMNVALRLKKEFIELCPSERGGARAAMQSHDELMYVCRTEYAPYVHDRLVEEMQREPDWWPGIPLDCEAHIGTCYGRVK